MKIIFEAEAYTMLQEALRKAGNRYEIGGVLIGERDETGIRVVALTAPKNSDNCTGFSFVLDGRKETLCVQKLQNKLRTCTEVVGVWHSHVDGNSNFSQQDRASNMIAAEQFDGAASVLAVREEKGVFTLFGTYIEPSGIEYEVSICTC